MEPAAPGSDRVAVDPAAPGSGRVAVDPAAPGSGRVAVDPAAPGSNRINSVTRVKGVGIDVPGHPVADTFGPTPVELPRLSFHDSSKFRVGPGKLTQAIDAEEHEGSQPADRTASVNRLFHRST
ncbi:hypothetical protein [Streptomyces mirabilis]|uniref:hypothetical protein n=1 Tax=Streptomyces mirabilis TaxID=68239 RepID=UPI003652B808